MAHDDGSDNSDAPILEAPPLPESPGASVGALFADDAFPTVTSKLTMAESMLRLLTLDQKFTDFMREILTTVMKIVKSEAGSIFELNYQNNTLFFRAAVGTSSDRVSHFVIPLGQGIVGYVAESKLPLNVKNVEENRVHLKSIAKSVGFETRNLIAIPILIRGKVFGVLELLNRLGEENYTEADVELLTTLCDLAAKAIEIRLLMNWAHQKAEKKAA